jgi:hypothetical protein
MSIIKVKSFNKKFELSPVGTAGPYDMNGIEVVRFKDGKAVEHWAFMDARDMMKMMPQQMPASAPTSTDKAK